MEEEGQRLYFVTMKLFIALGGITYAGDLTMPILKDRNFEMMFQLSRTHVQKIFEDVMHSNNAFYLSGCDATGAKGALLEAKILLPLKTMAFGTASHAFCDYFQMSKPLAVR